MIVEGLSVAAQGEWLLLGVFQIFITWPSISVGFTSMDSSKSESKIFGGKCCIIANAHNVVRPTMGVSGLNMYNLPFLVFIVP